MTDHTTDPLRHGLVGRIVQRITANSEAHPHSILFTTLAALGAMIGPGPHMRLGGPKHAPSLFVLIVGSTARSRKGTSWANVKLILDEADPTFGAERTLGGFGSGEVLIDTISATGPGVLVLEPEFSRILRVAAREGSTLSQVLRSAWDGGPLEARSRHTTAVATQCHLGVIAHITRDELTERLRTVELVNGFMNRFLVVHVAAGRVDPFARGIDPRQATELATSVNSVISTARPKREYHFTPQGRDRWAAFYHEAANDNPPGLLGAAVARNQPHVGRLALLWALIDQAPAVDDTHVQLAINTWGISRASLTSIFGTETPNRDHHKVLEYLNGVTRASRTDISTDVFSRSRTKNQIDQIQQSLMESGLIRMYTEKSENSGRPTEIWELTN